MPSWCSLISFNSRNSLNKKRVSSNTPSSASDCSSVGNVSLKKGERRKKTKESAYLNNTKRVKLFVAPTATIKIDCYLGKPAQFILRKQLLRKSGTHLLPR